MKCNSFRFVLVLVSAASVAYASRAVAEPEYVDQVIVQSLTVWPGTKNVSMGMHLENVCVLSDVVLPLEIRSVDSGAFIAGHFNVTIKGRLATSGLVDLVFSGYSALPDSTVRCSGPISYSYREGSSPDFLSPDAFYWAGVDTSGRGLLSGSDGVPGIGSPSLMLEFDVTSTVGSFEIDTCCFYPAIHLAYLSYACHPLQPLFTKGTVIISDQCLCRCHGDPVCDGLLDVLDVAAVIAQAFGGEASGPDYTCPHVSRTDRDCNCQVDVLDVIRTINGAFRGDASPPCDPCGTACR